MHVSILSVRYAPVAKSSSHVLRFDMISVSFAFVISSCLAKPILAFPVEMFDFSFLSGDRDAGGRELVYVGNDVGFVWILLHGKLIFDISCTADWCRVLLIDGTSRPQPCIVDAALVSIEQLGTAQPQKRNSKFSESR